MLSFKQYFTVCEAFPGKDIRPYLVSLDRLENAIYSLQPASEYVRDAHYKMRDTIVSYIDRIKKQISGETPTTLSIKEPSIAKVS